MMCNPEEPEKPEEGFDRREWLWILGSIAVVFWISYQISIIP